MSEQIPDFLAVVRTYRTVRELSFLDARDEALRIFRAKGWPVPRSFEKTVTL
jgi:hypothetical protein